MFDEDIRCLTRNTVPNTSVVVQRGEGADLFDADGRTILDFCSQTLNVTLGQCHPVVVDALREAATRLTFLSSRLRSPDMLALAHLLTTLAPAGLDRVNLKITSGSLANEGALKAAYKARGGHEVVSLMGSHHGLSMETMRVSGKHFERPYLRREGVHFVEPCRCGLTGEAADTCRCADSVADILHRRGEAVAAVIVEPILVDAGVIVQSPRFLRDLRAHTQEAGVALIFDEVQTAFGPLGSMFASELYGVTPDLMTLAKGLACSLPLAAVLTTEAYDILDYGEHELGAGGNQLLCAVAYANLTLLRTSSLLDEVREKGEHLGKLLLELQCEHPEAVADVRGLGLLYGVELRDHSAGGERTRRLTDACLAAGLQLRTTKAGKAVNVVQVKPPIVISRESLERGVGILHDVLGSVWR